MCYEERYFSEWTERAARKRREATQSPPPQQEPRQPARAEPQPSPARVPDAEPVTESA
jgi:hypothetical protein